MTSPLPNSAQPIGTTKDGKQVFVTPVWQRFFNTFLSAASPSVVAQLGASPVSIVAGGFGSILVQGGTVSNITLKRGSTVLQTGITQGFVPVANKDTVEITYSVAPTVTFVPS